MNKTEKHIIIPADVPHEQRMHYLNNYATLTQGTDHIFIFAADQKMEHLNKDFSNPEHIQNPEDLFKLAASKKIGCFAAHLGLIERYAASYPTIPYLVKLNGKTDLLSSEPLSTQLWSVAEAIALRDEQNLTICAVGYTIYLGSEHEQTMLAQAAEIIHQAHASGLLACLWIYPRGLAVTNPHDPQLTAGAAGVAASLGADIVKLYLPDNSPDSLPAIVTAAGNTKVIISGGAIMEPQALFAHIYENIHKGKIAGAAIGRNIFQHPFPEALIILEICAQLIYHNYSLEQAYFHYQKAFKK